MQMQMRTCDICGRCFRSGRALGGHMRSHMTLFSSSSSSAAAAAAASPSSSSSAAEEEEEEDKKTAPTAYGLRENPRKSFRVADPEFSVGAAGSTSLIHGVDSGEEAESSVVPWPSPERVSSSTMCDVITEEDVARCLVMLSRDAWTRFHAKPAGDGSDEAEEDRQIEGSRRKRRRQPAEGRSRFQCGTCKRVFKSYHALGGHRAGHKKMNTSCDPTQIRIHAAGPALGGHREFSSAQALGGHKKSHLYPSSPGAAAAAATVAEFERVDGSIDLNLPAPAGEDAELSSVSDAKVAFK